MYNFHKNLATTFILWGVTLEHYNLSYQGFCVSTTPNR